MSRIQLPNQQNVLSAVLACSWASDALPIGRFFVEKLNGNQTYHA